MSASTWQDPRDDFTEEIVDIEVSEELSTAFLEYALSVIHSRALPDARDGLKPVQRRILYSMSEMGLRPDRGHVKSSRIVGDVMGKYHPHGDYVIYEALVRMSQDFVMRLPLVDGHGNFGSLDDGPSAPRYTEARLAPAGLLLVAELSEDTVDFVPNYDGQMLDPVVLPTAYPNLLVNGVTGIAVGMVTNMAPHNLVEVISAARYLLDHPGCSIDDLMRHVPGPDLPGGGRIIGLDGIRDAYITGRGSFRTRATARIEKITPRKMAIVVTELPYLVGPEKVIDKVRDAVRAAQLQGISDVKDLTDRKNGLRLVFEIKNGFHPEAVLEQLYKLTPMEEYFGINAVALVDGEPRTMGLKELLQVFLDFRIEVVRRRTAYRLAKKEARLHLVEGLLVAILDIGEVTQCIRSSEDASIARQRLMDVFDFSRAQASCILDLQLRGLTRFSRSELEREKFDIERDMVELRATLGDGTLLRKTVSEELAHTVVTDGGGRRTVLLDEHGRELAPPSGPRDVLEPEMKGPVAGLPASTPQVAQFHEQDSEEALASLRGGGVDVHPRKPSPSPVPTPSDVFSATRPSESTSYDRSADVSEPVISTPDATPPRTNAEAMWMLLREVHPFAIPLGQRGPLADSGYFRHPGALYTFDDASSQIVVALAASLKRAAFALQSTPESVSLNRSAAIWVPGTEQEIRESSPILTAPRSALSPGRPLLVRSRTDWMRIPRVAGIYRLHRSTDGVHEIYVGRTSDFRRRPYRHEKLETREWGDPDNGVLLIECLPVKPPVGLAVWTVVDLDRAEEQHISRARDKEVKGGPKVINVTVGRNGPPSRPPPRVLVWASTG